MSNETYATLIRIDGRKVVSGPPALSENLEVLYGDQALSYIVSAIAHNFEQQPNPGVSLQKYFNAHLTQSLADTVVGTALRDAGKRLLRERRERNKRIREAFLATPPNKSFDPALVP